MGDCVHGVIKWDNYSIPRRSSQTNADAKEAKGKGSNYDNEKNLERSAELSNLGPGTSSRAGRRPPTPTREQVCHVAEAEEELPVSRLLSLEGKTDTKEKQQQS